MAIRRFTNLIALACLLGGPLCAAVRAQTNGSSTHDGNQPNMSGVTDVTGGMQYLLKDDDLTMLKVDQSNGTLTTSLVTMDTSNSKLSGTPQTTVITQSVNTREAFNPTGGVTASEATGRMYNIKTDTIALLNALDYSDTPPLASDAWMLTLYDPPGGLQKNVVLNSSFQPHGTVYTQVVMGNFKGDNLADPLVFYLSTGSYGSNSNNKIEWGMKALAAADPKTEGSVTEGPEFYNGAGEPVPVTGSIVVGDFNGDGRDEIAMLMTDYQTIAFYQVDPKSLAITPVPDPNNNNQPLTVKLPNLTMVSGQVALAAGRFRQCGGNGSPCQTNGVTNADLVVFGQIDKYKGQKADAGYSVIPVKITPNYNNDGTPSGTFSANVVRQPGSSASVSTPYFRFNDKHGSSGGMAQAAPLASWPQPVNEQLVLGIRTTQGASYIEIGTFQPNNNLDTFVWGSETKREYDAPLDLLQNMWVGNFDNLNPDGSHNPGLQIETYELVIENLVAFTPHVNIFNVNVPNPLPLPGDKQTNWLNQKSDNTSGIPLVVDPNNLPDPSLNFLVPGDLQGRSLRLGAPTIVRVTNQIQPDVVLAIPPMHVDWIAPLDQTLAQNNGCPDQTGGSPCAVNLSVLPDPPPASSSLGFATTFKFDGGTSSTTKQKSTTSWGISVKQSVGASFSFNDGETNASGDIKNTTQNAHDHTVAKTYDTYRGTTNSLSVTTGFSDRILFTERDMNVYYYPVLGCDSDGANCTKDGTPAPAYVQFSVPDNVTYNNQDAIGFDWYQPVHEPGNVFTYPWTLEQLESRFTDSVTTLTKAPSCLSLGSGTSAATTTWSQSSSKSNSSGSTNSFSDELSMSYSEGIGVEGADSADVNWSLDIAAHTSLDTLNESTSAMSSSQGITISEPDFGRPALCCNYGFGQYIFGLKNTKNAASQDACQNGQTPEADGCIAIPDPDSTSNPPAQTGIGSTGPLFTGYVASPVNGDCSGNNSAWWKQVYTLPDVGLNHPEQWQWDSGRQSVTFQDANSNSVLVDNGFYAMKGFFVSKKSAGGFDHLTLPSGPSLAVANADDPLTLTTRVYNYSLVDTTAPVHVRFYGQLYCNSAGEASCTNWKTNKLCTNSVGGVNTGDVCGDSFQIGPDQTISSIAGFNDNGASTTPNWQLTSVGFTPTDFAATQKGNLHMVFWVVVWMQDANGNPVAEMPDHGLIAIPDPGLTQITQVATQKHSNNVGMYPVHQFFQILPVGTPPAATGLGGGSLKSISLSTSSPIPLGKRTKLVATLHATGARMKSVKIAYYDGDPAKNGKLIDVQSIAYMNPDVDYYHRTFFSPDACGTHTLYAKAWTAGSPEVQASTTTSATLDPVDFAHALIASTTRANITNAELSSDLIALLNTALQDFQQGQTDAGDTALGAYMQQLAAASGNGITASSAGVLTGQAGVALGCGSSGFLVSASPSSATVSPGSAASYALAITPAGGFSGEVSLACIGAPQGIHCSFSSPSVTLDGFGQEHVTVTIPTGSSVTAAGTMGVMPSTGSARLKFLLMLLLTAFAAAFLRRARLRKTILGCLVAFMLLGGMSGCGSGSSGNTTPVAPGTYAFTLQATSGKTVRDTLLTLIVK